MGACCGKPRKVSGTKNSTAPLQVFENRSPIEYIMGVVIDRDIAFYQYALFCLTRLLDEYKTHIYPEVTMGLVSFREDYQHYFPVCREVQKDLSRARRAPDNSESNKRAKEALNDLAQHYIQKINTSRTYISSSPIKLDKSSSDCSLASKQYEQVYDDTLKVLMSDLERKEIWQTSTLFSNQEFQNYLREKEPETYSAICDDSLLIEVPLHPHGMSRTIRMCDMTEVPSDDECYTGPAPDCPLVNYYLPESFPPFK